VGKTYSLRLNEIETDAFQAADNALRKNGQQYGRDGKHSNNL